MDYDVIVVGAGPAGSTAAKFLAEKNVKVLLVDGCGFPRDKPCGGAVTPRVLRGYPYIEERGLVDSYALGGCMHSPSLRYTACFERDVRGGGMVLRERFDMGLVELAVESGAEFRDGVYVRGVNVLDDRVEVVLDNGEVIASEVVVGADGVFSAVAREAGLRDKYGHSLIVCALDEYPVGEDVVEQYATDKRVEHMYFLYEGVHGYGWAFAKKSSFNIGFGILQSDRKRNLTKIYRDYLEMLKSSGFIPGSIGVGQLKSGCLPLFPLKKTYADRVVLCGDAAGFVNPLTGEGIYYAMRSGEIGAGVISGALDAGDFSAAFLSRYQRAWKDAFGSELWFNGLLMRLSMLFPLFATRWVVERGIKLASMDEEMMHLIAGGLVGSYDTSKYKWRVIGLGVKLFLKDLFGIL